MAALTLLAADGVTIARRNLRKVVRVPEILVSVLVMPVMLILLFAYVFGSSIVVPGGSYREFLIGGVFAMTLVFGSTFTGAGLAEDLRSGVITRFRTLPMSRSAVIVGRTLSDVLYNVLSLVVMVAAGLLVGWRVTTGIGEAALGFGLLLVFGYAFSWVMAYVGLLVPSPEVVTNTSTLVIFPLTFIADTFAPAAAFPTPLRVFAEYNPVSAVTRAARELFGNLPAGAPEPTALPLQHPVAATLLWTALLIAVFAPLSVRRYRTAA